MSDQQVFRRADCGHYIPVEVPPVGVSSDPHGGDVYLCAECLERTRHRVETKDVRPVPLDVTFTATKSPDMEPVASIAERVTDDPREQGALTAKAGGLRRVPAGMHPRSASAREWLAAYDEAKGTAE